jgi:hypothetical protein
MESFLGNVNVLSDAFDRKAAAEESHDCIEGRLTGQSKGLKRPTFYREGGHSGTSRFPFFHFQNSILMIDIPSYGIRQPSPFIHYVNLTTAN